MNIRYPNITGKTPEERLRQMEEYLRYLAQTLNYLLKQNVR